MTDFVIQYRSSDGVETTRRISDLQFDEHYTAVDAFCHLRNERRSFMFSRQRRFNDEPLLFQAFRVKNLLFSPTQAG
jgi:predicted DNA-binding transcriptional regulator YafY